MKRKDTPKEKAQVENTPKEDRQEKAKPEENDSQTEPNQSNNNEADIPEPELAFKLWKFFVLASSVIVKKEEVVYNGWQQDNRFSCVIVND